MTLYIIACFVLILFVLLQPGKADASGMFGGGANSTAFGPRGTQTVYGKGHDHCGYLVLFDRVPVLAIPGLFEKRSLGEGVGPAESAPAAVPAPADETAPPEPPAAPPSGEAAPPPAKPDQAVPGKEPRRQRTRKSRAMPTSPDLVSACQLSNVPKWWNW